MYRTVYKTQNGKWRAEVNFDSSTRRTKSFESKSEALGWAEEVET